MAKRKSDPSFSLTSHLPDRQIAHTPGGLPRVRTASHSKFQRAFLKAQVRRGIPNRTEYLWLTSNMHCSFVFELKKRALHNSTLNRTPVKCERKFEIRWMGLMSSACEFRWIHVFSQFGYLLVLHKPQPVQGEGVQHPTQSWALRELISPRTGLAGPTAGSLPATDPGFPAERWRGYRVAGSLTHSLIPQIIPGEPGETTTALTAIRKTLQSFRALRT